MRYFCIEKGRGYHGKRKKQESDLSPGREIDPSLLLLDRDTAPSFDALAILSQEEFFISEARIMAIIRKNCDKLTDIEVRPVPKVKMPRVTARQLTLFAGE